MKELALHILDIAENSVTAHAKTVEISVEENTPADQLHIVIQDDGKGMDPSMTALVTDPFVTSRTTRKVGLGIPLLKAAAEECNGSLNITSEPGQGTRLEVTFQRSHIDRMPLGDLAGTLLSLVIGYPETRWVFNYRFDEKSFAFDSEPIKQTLDGISFTEPTVLRYIREQLEDGINSVRQTA